MPQGFIYSVVHLSPLHVYNHFIIDTGASCTIFDRDVMLKEYQVSHTKIIPASGNGVYLVNGGKMELLKFPFTWYGVSREFFFTDFTYLKQHSGLSIGGLVGTDLLTAVNAKIDLVNNELTISIK